LALGGEVLDAQVALNGGQTTRRDFTRELTSAVDSTPRFVAGMVLGAVATLFLLRVAGFRFSFGVGVGAGGS
jgi:hypothetical protein